MDDHRSTRALTRETANRLLQEQIRPSAKRIRAIINQGSLSTIQDELNQWWKELGQPLSDASDKLPAPVIELAKASWEWALKKAASDVQAHMPLSAEASARVARAEQEKEILLQEKQDLERTLMAANAVAEELRQQVAYLKGMMKTAQEDVIQARQFHREQIQLADHRYSERENQLMMQLDKERQARAAAEDQVRRLRAGLVAQKPRP